MCLYPKIIKNKKYVANKKNGGKVPPLKDGRVGWVPVGCGKCMECKKQKAREWSVRIQEETRHDNSGKFVTLSFSDESLVELEKAIVKDSERRARLMKKAENGLSGYNMENEIATVGMRRFLERWRKKYKKSVKHWCATELGQTNTERIHIHGIIWTEESNETIEEIWKYGNVFVGGWVNEITVNYIVKYLSKVDEKHPEYNSKVLTSPGIGKGYLNRIDAEGNKYNPGKTRETYKTRSGVKIGLPTYYRNHIYSEEEREKLWLEKLDKGERWVNGVKIDISETEEVYYSRLETERKRNKRLGYGDAEIDWEKRKYENDRRNLKKMERMGYGYNKDD